MAIKNRVDKLYKPVRPLTVKMRQDLSMTIHDARGVDYTDYQNAYFDGNDIMQIETAPGVLVDWSMETDYLFAEYWKRLEAKNA